MKKIRYLLLVSLLLLAGLWMVADTAWWSVEDFYAWRHSLLNGTGILAIGTMSLAMILATRWRPVERWLGGLDKDYRLHKWMGIAGLIFSVTHFLLANVPKLLVDAGTLEAPVETAPVEPASAMLAWFQSQYALAEEFGDWGFKIAAVLIAIALIKRFPYRFFFRSHRLLAAVYLILVFHSLVLLEFAYWGHAIAYVSLALMAVGTVAAVASLLGRVGKSRRAVGEIERFEFHEQNQVLKVGIRLKGRWAGHEEGQFAFVTFDRHEGAHPFTIATPWREDGRIGFFIKGLGDFTRELPDKLREGDLVTVEGPYGCFEFDNEKPRQIWIAGGIGVAPFAARLKALMAHPDDSKKIDFYYSASSTDDEAFIDRIRNASTAAHVEAHVLVPQQDGRLDAARICREVPEWREADFWFCGPTAFGDALRRDLTARGLAVDAFHQELFEMR